MIRTPFSIARRRRPILAAAPAIVAGLALAAVGQRVLAWNDGVSDAPDGLMLARGSQAETAPGREGRPAAVAAAAPEAPASQPRRVLEAPAIDFTAQLDRAGVAACRTRINALAASTIGGAQAFNTVSGWARAAGDKRAVSLAIGQRYAAGSAVPFGVSQIVAAPSPRGGCDGFTVQVLPSPLTCAKLRDAMAGRQSRPIGDLAGVAVMQDAATRTMLVPTAAGSCVLVATTSVYAD